MRIFASEKVSEIMKKLGMQEGEAIEHKWVAKSIENAQKRVKSLFSSIPFADFSVDNIKPPFSNGFGKKAFHENK